MASSSTITLQNSMDWASTFNFGRNFNYGTGTNPAFMSANIIVQTIMGPPFSWRWNRILTGFFTQPNVQDYLLYNSRPNSTSTTATSAASPPNPLQLVVNSLAGAYVGGTATVDLNAPSQETVLITAINTGAVAFTATFQNNHTNPFPVIFNYPVTLNSTLVDYSGNVQQVTTAGNAGTTFPPTWNPGVDGITTDGTVVWTNFGPLPLDLPVSDTYTFNWMETVSVQDNYNGSSPKWIEIETKINLGLDSSEARPKFVSAQYDDGLGNITFRLMPVPDTVYPVAITLQEKPLLFTSTSQTWAPIPDEYSHIYNWGFLALMWLYADDPRFAFANQKFVGHLLAASEGLTETEINIFLNNWQNVTGQPVEKSNRIQQGTQARGT